MNRESEIEAAMQQVVDSGELAGAATLVWRACSRNGDAQTVCVGDVEANLPVERDTIFRIASMTKPITSVAALRLVEEGRIALTDPIARYAPEFSHMRVLRAPNGPLDETDPVERPITVEDLLTHRAGFTYADFHRGPIAQAYRDALAAISIVRSRPISGSRGSRSYH
jgi:CubicO group peptidase (beta-lactamase class C family)